ncbi:hypothetical protein KQX54_013441 [Cotesia glomerata]|uniref:BEN domain-containing protein n=1 Tax=Cotesia glomerata TaxID=32391 RepID=A0AAV7IBS5_COTGL|nr:hypothetical protein KQX54_013441 [Cotesia glomerata]
MFLLECNDDNSLLIKRNESVICDHQTVARDHRVIFYHRKIKYNGTVRMIADDVNLLKKEIEKIRCADKKSMRNPATKSNTHVPKNVKSSKRKTVNSPDSPPNKRSKYSSGKTDSATQNESDDDTDPVSDHSRLSDDQLPQPITGQQQLEKNNDNTDNNEVILENDNDDDDEDKKAQLYSFSGIENMRHIGSGVYCRMGDYKAGIKGFSSATALARNLLVGVFKHEVLVQSSLTGRSPRSQGAARMKQQNTRLYDKATTAIIKYAKDYAKQKNWTGEASDTKIKSAMAQKIVELKGEHLKNSPQSTPVLRNVSESGASTPL